jgi:inhibitor of cysteine peptidase
MVSITSDMNGSHVDVLTGELIELQFSENPTTGYRWQMRSSGSPVLAAEGDSFQASGGAAGAGGIRQMRFRAAQAGSVQVELDYARAWEHRAVDTFKVTVRVKSS